MKKWLTSILVLFFLQTNAQENRNCFYIKGGIALYDIHETRFTSVFRKMKGYSVTLGYEHSTLKTTNRISIAFDNTYQKGGATSRSVVFRPVLRFEHNRQLNNGLSIGGYIDSGTIINARYGTWAGENTISYLISSSIGPTIGFRKNLQLGSQSFVWHNQFSIPLLSYVVRPSYTFPYTDNFLQNDVFDLGQKGLAKKIIMGGHFLFPNKFQDLKIQTGIEFPTIGQHWKLGLNYSFNILKTNELKPVTLYNNEISIVTKIIK